MKKRKYLILYSPIFFGVVVGALVVLAQPFFRIQPPQAYGICTICHARDLLNWFSNLMFPIEMDPAEVAIKYPLLTTIGLVMGSIISSKSNKEFRFIRSENYFKMFILGLIVSNFGLLILSCPTRLVLRLSFGDPFGFIGLIGLIIGIAFGVIILKWRSRF